MTIDDIKELIRVVDETGIAELEVQRGENRVRIRRTAGVNTQEVMVPSVVSVPVAAPAPQFQTSALPLQQSAASAALQPPPLEDDRNAVVKSPIVGTYYDSPSPDAPAFVKVGDRVHPKQILCIIESMKLMNEIEAEIAGTIAAKLVENGRPVEYGEALFSIRPA